VCSIVPKVFKDAQVYFGEERSRVTGFSGHHLKVRSWHLTSISGGPACEIGKTAAHEA
jgi:hypothetical protein